MFQPLTNTQYFALKCRKVCQAFACIKPCLAPEKVASNLTKLSCVVGNGGARVEKQECVE